MKVHSLWPSLCTICALGALCTRFEHFRSRPFFSYIRFRVNFMVSSSLDLWIFDLKSGQRVTRDVGNLHVNFRLSRSFQSAAGAEETYGRTNGVQPLLRHNNSAKSFRSAVLVISADRINNNFLVLLVCLSVNKIIQKVTEWFFRETR